MVSLVPVMAPSPPARIVAPLGRLIPEISVLADEKQAATNLTLPADIDRLVIWARVDPWVKKPPNIPAAEQITVTGTHNTVVAQQNVYDLVVDHFRR